VSATQLAELPTFLVIGAMKSGTTSLTRYLGRHPDVLMLDREVAFFDRFWDRGLDWYRSQFAAARDQAARGESGPTYMFKPEAVPRIASVLPDARLIAILRHPVERAYSHYWHNRTRGHEPLEFLAALDAEEERLVGADERIRSRFSYLSRGRYLAQLQRVADHFPRSALDVVLLDDLHADPQAVVQHLFRFLGVDDTVVPEGLGEPENPFISFRSMRLRRPIRRLPMPLRRIAGRLNVRYTTYPPLPPSARDAVWARFAADQGPLEGWLGRNLDCWAP
jgi:Sulfotransferase domain